MLNERDIRSRLNDVLQGAASVEEFGNWLAAARDGSGDESLAFRLLSVLYQYFDGHMPLAALWEELGWIANIQHANWIIGSPPPPVARAAANNFILWPQEPVALLV